MKCEHCGEPLLESSLWYGFKACDCRNKPDYEVRVNSIFDKMFAGLASAITNYLDSDIASLSRLEDCQDEVKRELRGKQERLEREVKV